MQTEQTEILCDVFVSVVEKLAFMFGDPVPTGELSPDDDDFIQAKMSFSGDHTGWIAVVVPTQMCTEIAANVLGMDEDDEEVLARGTDALKEVLNVTCGHVLTSIAGEQPIFDLSVPVITKMDVDDWETFCQHDDTLGFNIDENPVLLRFALDG